MTRTGAPSHDRDRKIDFGGLAYSEEENSWVGTLGDVQVYLPGSPKAGVSHAVSSRADAVLKELARSIGVAREALIEEVTETERADWQCVDVRFFEADAKKDYAMTFVMASEAGAEWDVWFRGQRLISVRRKIALW